MRLRRAGGLFSRAPDFGGKRRKNQQPSVVKAAGRHSPRYPHPLDAPRRADDDRLAAAASSTRRHSRSIGVWKPPMTAVPPSRMARARS